MPGTVIGTSHIFQSKNKKVTPTTTLVIENQKMPDSENEDEIPTPIFRISTFQRFRAIWASKRVFPLTHILSRLRDYGPPTNVMVHERSSNFTPKKDLKVFESQTQRPALKAFLTLGRSRNPFLKSWSDVRSGLRVKKKI